MSRTYALKQVLEQIGDPNEVLDGDHSRHYLRERPLHKNELREIFDLIAPPEVEMPGTVPELRDAIRRESVFMWTDSSKSPKSNFSSSELHRINRSLSHADFLERRDVDLTGFAIGDRILVNDDLFEVVGHDKGTVAAGGYSGFELVILSPRSGDITKSRRRLVSLRDFDPDECKYEHSLVLEREANDRPYKRWVKTSYVDSIERE